MKERVSFGRKLGLSLPHASTLARLRTPEKIQDYITALRCNHERHGDSCLSVKEVLDQRHAHCIEGAFVAACTLWMGGQPPLLMDLKTVADDDHVIALFRYKGCFGAISKSNHVTLRWRDPVYKSLRELAMSYFHEYALGTRKTLRSYSTPFDLRRYDPQLWVTNRKPCWDIAAALDISRHYPLITRAQANHLRPRDKMEMRADKIIEYKKK